LILNQSLSSEILGDFRCSIPIDAKTVAQDFGFKIEPSELLKDSALCYPEKNLIIVRKDTEPVIFHEIAHCIDYKLGHTFRNRADSEAVAEICAWLLCIYFHYPVDFQAHYRYLMMQDPKDMKNVMRRVNGVIGKIRSSYATCYREERRCPSGRD